MKNKILIIITRAQGYEYPNYWKYNNQEKFNIFNNNNGFIVIFINGFFLADDNYTKYLNDLVSQISQKIYLNNAEVGIISHGLVTNPSINDLNNYLSFNNPYSSALNSAFCESRNGDFVSPSTKPVTPRTGFLDAFRDAVVFNSDNIEEAFNNLWNYFKGTPKLNAALKFLHECLVESAVPKNTEILNGILELETQCTKGKANGITVNVLFANLKKDYKEENLISLRDGVLEMAGVK